MYNVIASCHKVQAYPTVWCMLLGKQNHTEGFEGAWEVTARQTNPKPSAQTMIEEQTPLI